MRLVHPAWALLGHLVLLSWVHWVLGRNNLGSVALLAADSSYRRTVRHNPGRNHSRHHIRHNRSRIRSGTGHTVGAARYTVGEVVDAVAGVSGGLVHRRRRHMGGLLVPHHTPHCSSSQRGEQCARCSRCCGCATTNRITTRRNTGCQEVTAR